MVDKCKGIKKNGEPCRYSCKNGDYCRIHAKKQFTGVNEEGDCPICFDSISGASVSGCKSCKYKFHSECLSKALDVKSSCPCCRAEIIPMKKSPVNVNSDFIVNVEFINSYLDSLMDMTPEDIMRELRSLHIHASY